MKKLISLFFLTLIVGCTNVPYNTDKAEVAKSDNDHEVLNFRVPRGWGIAHQAQNQLGSILELISDDEELSSWTRLISIQTFKNPGRHEPEEFILSMAELAKKQCDAVEVYDVKNDFQNGYPFSQKIISCIGKNGTDSNESMHIKTIKSDNNFYVIQFSYRVGIDKQEAYFWATYLRDIVVSKS